MCPPWPWEHLLHEGGHVSAAETWWQRGERGFDENQPAFMCSQRGSQPPEYSSSICAIRRAVASGSNRQETQNTHTRTQAWFVTPSYFMWTDIYSTTSNVNSCTAWLTNSSPNNKTSRFWPSDRKMSFLTDFHWSTCRHDPVPVKYIDFFSPQKYEHLSKRRCYLCIALLGMEGS